MKLCDYVYKWPATEMKSVSNFQSLYSYVSDS